MFLKKLVVSVCVILVASSILAYGVVKVALFVENPVPTYQIAPVNVRRQVKELGMKDYVLREFSKAGIDVKVAEAVINCESRWNPDAININTNKTYDAGILQINSIHKDISLKDKLDYKKAVAWAVNKVKRDGGFNAWTCSRLVARN